MLAGQDSLFGAVMDDEQRLKLRRIQAFMTYPRVTATT